MRKWIKTVFVFGDVKGILIPVRSLFFQINYPFLIEKFSTFFPDFINTRNLPRKKKSERTYFRIFCLWFDAYISRFVLVSGNTNVGVCLLASSKSMEA